MCSNGTCLPVSMASLAVTSQPVGLAANSSTVFTTVPGGSAPWSLYGLAKTAVNASPSPILTTTAGNLTTGFLGANDSLAFVEPGYTNPGGSSFTMISCNPTNCANTQQSWYTSHGSVSACDPSAQECFVEVLGSSSDTWGEFEYAKMGMSSQTSPQNFIPAVNMAVGIGPTASGGYLYMAGDYGAFPNPPRAVLQRVSQDGTSGVSTLADLGLTGQYTLTGPLVVTDTRVYVVGADVASGITGLIAIKLPNGVGDSAPPFLPGTTTPSSAWIAAWGDDTAVYFANSAHQWVTCPAAGCTGSPRVLADASAALPYLTGDAQALYWINATSDPKTGFTTGFSVMKVAR
jgi:hypothetical protein